MIGPHRASRTKAATGVPGQPNVFYIGVVNGGVWKTTDYGRTWAPIFDDQPTGSIGAIAVAPSEPGHHLRRQRRGHAAARPVDRRRHLQVDRRRPDVDAPRAARRPADSADHRRSARPGPPVRRGARPSVRPQRRARHLPVDSTAGRRSRRCSTRTRHRRRRRRVRSRPTRTIVYAVLWEARQGPWENGACHGPGQRALQVRPTAARRGGR